MALSTFPAGPTGIAAPAGMLGLSPCPGMETRAQSLSAAPAGGPIKDVAGPAPPVVGAVAALPAPEAGLSAPLLATMPPGIKP